MIKKVAHVLATELHRAVRALNATKLFWATHTAIVT
jgi:hypothetical protein